MKRSSCVLLVGSLWAYGAGCGDNSAGSRGGVADAGAEDSGWSQADPTALLITLTTGSVQGARVGGARQFLGIPYGKAPVGALRFMPPEPAESWTETLQATEFGPSCAQAPRLISPAGALSEDCLSLNVFAPDGVEGPRPVMVWIHGGGFTGGGSSQYDGTRLATERGVIVVTLNYRLGPFGFFTHPELDAQRGEASSGNDGLRDQQLALRWVQDNIAAFGGDPARVTVFGESAGGFSTCMHFVSPTAQNLAQRYIIQSGACVATGGIASKESGRALSAEFAATTCGDAADLLACLRDKDASELALWGADRTLLGAGWVPVFGDGDQILPTAPLTLVNQGSHNEGELMIGTNRDEHGFFVRFSGPVISSLSDLEAALTLEFASYPGLVPLVLQHYMPNDATAAETYIRVLTDAVFRCPARTLARAATAQGTKVYLYSFEHGLAYHAYELPYVFGNPNALLETPKVDPLHGFIAAYWTGFAAEGEPSAAGAPEWSVYDVASDPHMRLVDPPEASSDLAKEDCDFWDSLAGG